MGERKLLCIADESPECRNAVVFGAERAKRTNATLIIVRVIRPLDMSLLGAIGGGIIDEVRAEAMEDLGQFAALAKNTSGIIAETLVYEGAAHDAIRAQIDADEGIKTLLLAASGSRNGLGPLVSSALRESAVFGKRKVAIMIVPDGLDDTQIIELAS
ncbi:MAG: hypothetical protein FD163_1368 [Hyphomonadaceae bacterium]|nr:MAG: hypothetical protein FD128_654 [Hyphomonadaceae bacterium]KAF0184671.1 MAG: hypothetical protein FD163_1368 [Hyphomonadaceae bacterium]